MLSDMKTTANEVVHFALYTDGSGLTALIVVDGVRFSVNVGDHRLGASVAQVQNKRQSLTCSGRAAMRVDRWADERVRELSDSYRARNEALYA